MKTTLLEQIRKRRLALGIKILEMPLLTGLTRQQYGKIEARGNPRLNSLDQIAEGLDSALVLVPKNRLREIEKILSSDPDSNNIHQAVSGVTPGHVPHETDGDDENPWRDL